MGSLGRRSFLAGGLLAVAVAACSRRDGTASVTAPTRPAPPGHAPAPATTPPATNPPATSTPGTAALEGRWTPPVEQYPAAEPFAHGVASGEPAATSVLLWTQLTAPGAGPVSVVVASDPGLADVVATGAGTADTAGAVHIVIDGLAPGREWFYRFERGGAASPIGRAVTLPDGPPDRLFVALASCQHYEEGWFTALGDLADASPDLVVHVGDFVYARDATGDPVRSFPGGHGPIADRATRLARYDGYLRDAHLQRARAAAPWLCLWDDNELRGDGDPAQVWRDHMPIGGASGELRRSVDVGGLVHLVLVDTRAHRDPPVCDRLPQFGVAERCAALDAPERSMLGAEQERWLGDALAATSATWTLVASQVVVTDLTVDIAGVSGLNDDQWDGYPAARGRLLDTLAGRSGALVLSGDLHSAGLATLRDATGAVAGHEILGPSVSSVVGGTAALGLDVAALGQPDLEFLDVEHRGWVRLDVGTETIAITYRCVDATEPEATAEDGRAYELGLDGRLQRR